MFSAKSSHIPFSISLMTGKEWCIKCHALSTTNTQNSQGYQFLWPFRISVWYCYWLMRRVCWGFRRQCRHTSTTGGVLVSGRDLLISGISVCYRSYKQIKLVWSRLVSSGMVWSGLVWYGLVWSGLVSSGLVWSSAVCPHPKRRRPDKNTACSAELIDTSSL
jgi:hypothetical protein